MNTVREKLMGFMDTTVFLKGVENEDLRRKIEVFYSSLTSELDTSGISLAEILQCRLLIVKEEDGRILGISGVLTGNYTFDVVKKEYQNRKIGRVLLEELVKWAQKAGYDFVMGNTLVSNVKINRICREMGWRVLYTSVLGGREHYLQFNSLNWRGVVWGCVLKILWFVRTPNWLVGLLSKMLKILRLT